MVDAMVILGAAARAKLTADRWVRDLVTYFLEANASASVLALPPTTSRPRRKRYRLSRSMKPSLSGLGPRPSSRHRKKNISLMTDAELEAELDNRRNRRAKERDLYSRAMRSEKLSALEYDLADLRKEMRRIDPVSSIPALHQRPPHSVRWQPLLRMHRSLETGSSALSSNLSLPPPQPSNTSSAPPPPPPPPTKTTGAEDDVLIVDSEKRKGEKEERQKRREAKRREREQSKKPTSLADVIRSAGPDPMKRLTPATRKAADLEKEEYDKQKKEREERENRQEEERIEQEKKEFENMGRRRIVEENSTASGSSSQQSGKSGHPNEQPTNSCTSKEKSEDSVVHGTSVEHKNLSANTEKTIDLEKIQVLKRKRLSDPTAASRTGKESHTGTQDLSTGPGTDAIGTTRMSTPENNDSSESEPERQTRSAESQKNVSLSSVTKDGNGRSRQKHEKVHASSKPVTGPVENEAGQVLTKPGRFTDLGGDTENTSPNTSSECSSLKEERKKNDPKAAEMSKCPPTT